jgi:adenylosuccinate lyase
MNYNYLHSISPIDGRYLEKCYALRDYFSEAAFFKYRIKVEVEYFIALCNWPLPQLEFFPKDRFDVLRQLYLDFSFKDAERIKEIEKITNHDIKAVEYFIKEKMLELKLEDFSEFVHFGLTSQDINNTSIPLLLKDALQFEIFPQIGYIITELKKRAEEWKKIPMLARTHGQAASPTTVGKELYVFVERLEKQFTIATSIPLFAKFGGATGNFNAHFVAYPQINWVRFAQDFIEDLGLERSRVTTQIEHYDMLAAVCDTFKRLNNVLIDFSRDVWTYISMDYFKQKVVAGEVGSSAMPHKVNPIDFENAEGNLAFANAIFEFMSAKLPVSRLQRDLTDSTVLRNLGVPFANSFIAYASLLKGLSKLTINTDAIQHDLNNNWAVMAEAIQTILRRESYPKPYEALKNLTRGNENVSKESIAAFVDTLDVSEKVKEELKSLSPANYTGISLDRLIGD